MNASVSSRNDYPARSRDTWVGTIGLQIPRLRQGTCSRGWLPELRRRAEKALTAEEAEEYLLGVQTRKVEDLVKRHPGRKDAIVSVLGTDVTGPTKASPPGQYPNYGARSSSRPC